MEQITPEFELDLDGFRLLGRGSAAAGGLGWSRNPFFSYRCASCGGVMQADHEADFNCDCGAMSLEAGTSRFGSSLGDDNILVYQFML